MFSGIEYLISIFHIMFKGESIPVIILITLIICSAICMIFMYLYMFTKWYAEMYNGLFLKLFGYVGIFILQVLFYSAVVFLIIKLA